MSSDDDNEADTVDPEHASLVAHHKPAKSASLSMSCPPSLWMVSSSIGLSQLGDSMLYAVLPVIHREINIPVEAVGVLLSANRFVRLVSNVAAGSIVIRYGRRIPFLAALIMAAAVTTSYGLVTGVWGFLAARLLWGISWSFIRMEGMSTVLDLASPALGTAALRGTYMGIYQSLARLGGAAGMLVGSTLSDIVGYSSAFVLLGCLTCVAPVLAFAEYTLRSSRGSRTPVTAVRSNNNANEDDANANANAKSSEKESAAEVEAGEGTNTNTFTSPTPTTPDHTRAHVAAVFLGGFTNRFVIDGICTSILGYCLSERFGDTPVIWRAAVPVATVTGVLLSSRGIVETAVAPLTGYLGDVFGRAPIVACLLPVGAALVVCVAVAPSVLALVCAMPALYVAGVALSVSFNTLSSGLAPRDEAGRTLLLSRYLTCNDLGAALGPLLAYTLAPRIGLLNLYVGGAGLMAAVGLLFAVVFFSWWPLVGSSEK